MAEGAARAKPSNPKDTTDHILERIPWWGEFIFFAVLSVAVYGLCPKGFHFESATVTAYFGAMFGGTLSLLGFYVAIFAILAAVKDNPSFIILHQDGHYRYCSKFILHALILDMLLNCLCFFGMLTNWEWLLKASLSVFLWILWLTLKNIVILAVVVETYRYQDVIPKSNQEPAGQ